MATYIISSGETCNDITLYSGDQMEILSGGIALNTMVNNGGRLYIYDGGSASGVTTSSGFIRVSSGGRMEDAELCFGGDGLVTIESGGILSSAEVLDGLGLYVYGAAYDIVLSRSENNGGNLSDLFLRGNGYAENVTIYSSSYLYMESNTSVNGLTILEPNILLSIYNGAKIENLRKNPFTADVNIPTQAIVSYDTSGSSGVFIKSGQDISSAETMESVILNSNTSMFVCSGASVNTISINSGASLSVASGGTATGIAENGGYVSVENGADVTFAANVISELVLSNASATVHSGTTASSTMINSNGKLYVSSGGVVNSTTVNSNGKLYVSNGGTANDVIIHDAGRDNGAYVYSGGEVNGVIIDNGGNLYVSNGATVLGIVENGGRIDVAGNASATFVANTFSNVVVRPYSDATIHSGTTAVDTIMEGGWFWIYDGGVMNGAVIHSGVIYVSSGGVVNHVVFVDIGGTNGLNVYDGGTVNDVSVCSSGSMFVSGGGTATDISVASGGNFWAYNNATVNQVSFASGARVNNITLAADTSFENFNNAVFSGGTVVQDTAYLYAGQTASNTLVNANAHLYVSSGAVASDTTVFGELIASWGGIVADTIVESGGRVRVEQSAGIISDLSIASGGVLESSYLKKGDTVGLGNGAIVRGTLRNAANLIIDENVDFSNATITMDFTGRTPGDGTMFSNMASLSVSNMDLIVNSAQTYGVYTIGANAADYAGTITVKNESGTVYGQLSLAQPRINWEVTEYVLSLNESNELCLTIGSSIPEGAGILLYKNGQLVGSLQSAYELTVPVEEYEHMIVVSNGVAEETRVNSGGVMTVMSGGQANETHMGEWGVLEVLGGGSANGVILDKGGTISVNGGEVYGITTNDNHYQKRVTISNNGLVADSFIARDASVTVESGGRLENSNVLETNINVNEGGVISSLITSSWCGINVFGFVIDTEVLGWEGHLILHEGAQAQGTHINYSNAYMTISGGLASDTIIERGNLYVSSGGTATKTILSGERYQDWTGNGVAWFYRFTGAMTISEGGLGVDTQIIRSIQTVSRGGVASRTTITSMGSQVVSNGGFTSETTVMNGGRLIVSRGGVAKDIHAVQDGAIVVGSYGVASEVELDTYNMMQISSTGRAEDVNVKSGGEVYLLDGAVLGGHLQLANGAVVSAYEGATIDFELSKANATTPLIDNLSVITGAPSFTITVNAETEAGTYLLATGAADFGGTITVQDETMKYGSLTLSNPLVYGWNTYTLNKNGDALALSVTRNATEAPSNGELISHEMIYDAVIQAGKTISITSGLTYYEANVNNGGILNVVSNGVAEETRVNSGGVMTVMSGGQANETHMGEWGVLEVLGGGSANGVILDKGGTISVNGGEVYGITTNDNHYQKRVTISNNGLVADSFIARDASVTVESGGRLENSNVLETNINVNEGGVISSLITSSWCGINVFGFVIDTEVLGWEGHLILHEGAQAQGTHINYSNAYMTISGGLASDTIIERGNLYVSSGGTATKTILSGERYQDWTGNGVAWFYRFTGAMTISEGGLGVDTQIIRSIQTVSRGGVASRTTITSMGSQVVSNGGFTSETTVMNGGRLIVSRGGVAKDVHAVRDGAVVVGSYGVASEVVLDAYNMMQVSSTGRAVDVNVKSGGEVYLLDGAVLGGKLRLENGAVVSAYEGATVDFDISKANATTALIDNLNVITGTPSFTLTINAETEAGTYLLATGAADFGGTITVQDDTMRYGALTVDNPLVAGWNTYTLNLNNDALFVTITGNDVYHEPVNEETEPEEIIVTSDSQIATGETLVWEKTGETLRVTSGGVLNNTEIPWGGTLILEEGAILQGTVRLGTDVQVKGIVNAENANIELDISNRKEEYGLQLDNMAYVAALTYSVIVSPDQNKGEYILAGNAGDFDGAFTIKNTNGITCGTITVEQGTLDYGITHYTLSLNEQNQLVFIVSSNIDDETDYILLKKNDIMVLKRESARDVVISTNSEYDHMIVLDKGVADQITIAAGGLVTVQAGGTLIVKDQNSDGKLRFDYTAGDSTVIKGLNQYGAFFVGNNLLENVQGEVVNVTGNVLIRGYHGTNSLTTRNGVEVTGTGEGGEYNFYGTWIHDFTMGSANWARFYEGTIVEDTEWNNSVEVNSSSYVDRAVFNSSVNLRGGTLSNVVFNSGVSVNGYISVKSDLFFKQAPSYGWNGRFDMNGHIAVMDYTTRGVDSGAMISQQGFTENVIFQLNLNENQVIGKYAIATNVTRAQMDTYYISVNGNVIGTINDNNMEFVSGNYVYTMTRENGSSLYLTIAFSENADEVYNVYWYDTDKLFYHAAKVSDLTIGQDTYPQAVVRNNGVLYGSKLVSGGFLDVWKGGQVIGLDQEENGKLHFDYTAGDNTVITGANQYGGFIVRGNVMENVYGENVTVSGQVAMHNYHGIGTLTTQNGVSITGTLGGGWYNLYDTTIHDFTLESGNDFNYYSGTITDATFNGGRVYFRGGTISDAEFNTYVYFYGGTISNLEINNGYSLNGNVILAGDITLNCSGSFSGNSCFNVNGHTVTVDYRNRSVTDGAMFSVRNFSEKVNFRLLFQNDQKIGTYTIANNAGSFVDFFLLNIGGEDTEELSFENTEMDYGNYHYTMAHNVNSQLITLTIDISAEADETFNLYYWDSAEEEFYHAAKVDGLDFSANGYHDLVVRDGGIVTNSTLKSGGIMTVKTGGQVVGLDHYDGGILRFNYTQDDTTVIKGMNQYGAFFVENDLMENVYGENITVTGDVLMRNYHSAGGTLNVDGARITGMFEGSGTLNFNNSTIYAFEANGGRYYFRQGTSISQSVINVESTVENGVKYVEDTTFNSRVYLNGGTYSEVVVNSSWSVSNYIYLDGDLTFRNAGSINNGWWNAGAIDARGFTINLDLTKRTEIDPAMVNIDRIFNADLRVIIDQTKAIGTFVLGSSASQIGQGNGKGVYNWDTNKWDYQGATIGDLDNVISVYDSNGIELATCTVNGDTEYYGRYNYTVFVDTDGALKLKVGWNNREDQSYSADELERNDTRVTATTISGNYAGAISALTIHSATDEDWFKFNLATTGRKSSYIGIDFKQWAGDLDINLYNSNGELIDYARSVTDNERLSLSGLAAGDYYLKVSGYNGNKNSYKLVYNLPEPIVLTDAYENGDTKAHSYHLGKLSEKITLNAAISRTNDLDYYKFQLPKKGLTCDTITLTYDDEIGDLDLYLYGSNGMTLLATSQNTSGGQDQISLAGMKHGVYYVAVKAKNGGLGNYQLKFDVNAHEVNPDRFEGNNTLKKATKLNSPNGKETLTDLSIHIDEKNGVQDIDYYKFSLLEKGSADDYITLSCEVSLGDLDLEILNASGEVVAWSRTAENDDTVSLNGFAIGEYYIRVSGYNSNVMNNYTLSWNVTNSSLIPSDCYEGMEPITIREDQTISGLSIAKPVKDDETREDTFKIVLEYDAWKRSKIILTDYRSDWEDGLAYVIKDANENVLKSGTGSEISLYGLKKGEYYLTVDTPKEDEYSEYNLIAQCLPDSNVAKDNTWSIFIYMAGDNNLEGAYLNELLYMQKAILPENVEVYVLLDRSEGDFVGERDWSDTRVGKIRHSDGGAVAVEWMYFDGVNTDTYMNTHNLELQKEWDTGDVATLEAFLDWGMQVGRADNYALIMKDHGTSLGYNCLDEGSGSIMSIKDIATLLKAGKYRDLSVVAFDQCLMGSDVVITTMEGTVDYVVASESVGYTPNWLVMYKVLLNSFETNMTPREVSQKIVAACNCSGYLNLTSASFNTANHTLSEALEAFGEASKGFTRQDWIAICKSFAQAYNYGDSICAYSDLGFFLSTLKEYSTTISGTLMEATETLYNVVLHELVDSTMITPTTYGSGLAVFNPVLSSDMMTSFSYGPGANLDYYGTVIGQTDWGKFLYTAGRLAEDCTEYFVDSRTNLTFTDISYSFEEDEVQVTYNLGAFYGNGVEYNGLYMDKKAHFTISLDKAGVEEDEIQVFAYNPDANITITLIETEYTLLGPVERNRIISTDGILSLAGVDPAKAGVDTEYDLIITSDRETTYDLLFVADWSSGSDYFDYSRSGSLGAQGNGSMDKATVLAAGNYGGLVTYAGDADFYKLSTVYADTLDVTVIGSGLTVQEFNAAGDLLKTLEEEDEDGYYKLTVANGNYLRVEGDADLSANEVNSYSLFISDVASTYIDASGSEYQLPQMPDINADDQCNQIVLTLNIEDGTEAYESTDLQNWTLCENDSFVAKDDGLYYFKSVDTETGLESKYRSYEAKGIENVAPTISIEAGVAAGAGNNLDVVLSATFADDVELVSSRYRRGSTGTWIDYEGPVTVSTGETIYFKATDVAGNETIESYTVSSSNARTICALAALDSTTSLTISDGIYTDYGTILSGVKATIQGDKNGSTRMISVIGGILADTSDGTEESPVERNIDLTIEGGTFSNIVTAGNNIAMGSRSEQYFVTGEPGTKQQLTISDGLFNGAVVAEDRFVKGILERSGDIEMNISGGTFTQSIGGGVYNYASTSKDGMAYISGNISLNITGGTFSSTKWIYGGCVSEYKKKNLSTLAKIDGNITITVDSSSASSTNPIALCSIYVGSHGWGTVTGNTKLVFKGNGGKAIQFYSNNGELWGSSSGDHLNETTLKIDKNDSAVEGDRILSFEGFSGALNCTKIRAFTHIEFKDSSSVELDNGGKFNLSGFENWEFENGSTLSGNFTNDFAGDTLNLVGFSNMATGVSNAITLLTDSNNTDEKNVFQGFATLGIQMYDTDRSVVAVSSKSFDGDNNIWSFSAGGSNYKLALETSGISTSMILTKLA